MAEIIDYILSKGDSVAFSTYANVVDTFGTTELENRLSALEEKLNA